MLRYIVRRILQMIPTVLGVIIITFVLFNIVGGSPAQMTLGKHVSPQSLEEFDEQRGFNKPLLFGWSTTTRALEDSDFSRSPGPWRTVEGAQWSEEEGGFIALPAGTNTVPLAFALRPETRYRLKLTYRTVPGAKGLAPSNPGAGGPQLVPSEVEGSFAAVELPNLGKITLDFSKDWKRVTLDFQTFPPKADPPQAEEKPTPADLRLDVPAGRLEIGSITLRRKVANPFDSQLFFYFRQLARLDFGVSSSTNQRISQMLKDGILPSLVLTVPIFFVGVIVSVGLSLVCAFFRDTRLDRGFVVLSVMLMSVNYLVYIIVGQYVLAYRLGVFPIWGFESWRYLVLPAIIGVISGLGAELRFYRTIMLDEMYKDYVRTAFAKGVSRPGVLLRHVLKNAMIPIITNVVIAIPFLYTGSLLLESFFGIPGLGYMGVNAINSSDVDVVRALVFIGAVLYVAANLLTDICYGLVDPRVRLE